MFSKITSNNTNINKDFENYIKQNPLSSDEQIYKKMLDDGVITKEEYAKIINGEAFKFTEKQQLDTNQIFGLNLSKPQQQSEPNKPKTHPNSPSFIINEDGTLDTKQFTLESVKERYPEDKYFIDIDKENNSIIVVDKNTKNIILAICKSPEYETMHYFEQQKDGTRINCAIALGNKNRIEHERVEKPDGHIIEKYYHTGYNSVQCEITTTPDGTKTERDYKKDGKITNEAIYINNETTPSTIRHYSNGYLYEEIVNGNSTPVLTNEILEFLKGETGPDGLPYINGEIKNTILEKLTEENFEQVSKSFKERTGIDLITGMHMIGNAIEPSAGNKIINHVEKLYMNTPESGNYIASNLFENMVENNTENISKYIKHLNSTNLKTTIESFKTISLFQNNGKHVAHFSGLLSAINNEDSLTPEQKETFLKSIVEISLSGLPENDRKEIINDIRNHPENFHKIEIDVLRAINKQSEFENIYNLENNFESPNAKFDKHIKQGRIGDCWLLATLNSMIAKEKGKELLESLISIDNEGNATIKLLGAKKTYTFTKEELQSKQTYSTGDEDARIFELAFDKLLKEISYENELRLYDDNNYAQLFALNGMSIDSINNYAGFYKTNSIDINGNNSTFMIEQLLGPEYIISNYYLPNETADEDSSTTTVVTSDSNSVYTTTSTTTTTQPNIPDYSYYNDSNMGYSMSLADGCNEEYYAIDENGNEIRLRDDHAYSIVGYQDNNVLIINPWDSSKILKIPSEKYQNMQIWISSWSFEPIKQAFNEEPEPNIPDQLW